MLKNIIFSLFFVTYIFGIAQAQERTTSAELYEAIRKLNFLGSALYVGAHPDDENTAMISYLANDKLARTAYMSMTRGDGGQNLIGPELRELLGVIRTQELLQARKTDGGIQFFSRANDFGFSKNPEETFEFWEKEKVLSDLVYVIRKFKPDVIINRFDHRTPGATHGHHTASAILSKEAFQMAGDTTKFPEHLETVSSWQPYRLFFNDSWFLYESKEAFENADHSPHFKMNIGAYYNTLGVSNGEISAFSRSQHSSQGFGASGTRGHSTEYLEILEGEMPKDNIFDGIVTSWKRVRGGEEIENILSKVEENFDFKNPSASLPDLIKAYQLIQKLEDRHWKTIKTEEIKEIITDALGLYLSARAPMATAIAGEKIKVKIEAINRSQIPVHINSISINGEKHPLQSDLTYNRNFDTQKSYLIPQNTKPTTPYWLNEPHTIGMYHVSDPKLIGSPETPAPIKIEFNLNIAGQDISIQRDLIHSYTDPAKGEVLEPFTIVPKVSLKMEESVVIHPASTSKEVSVKVEAFTNDIQGKLKLKAPTNWKITPSEQSIILHKKGETQTFQFEILAPRDSSDIDLKAELEIDNQIFDKQIHKIDYGHIPSQKVMLPAEAKHVRIDIQKKGNKIAYIEGAGDQVAENLKQIGYEVETITPESIKKETLKNFDAIILGVRAFNVVPELQYKNKVLFDYVKKGGNVIVQYNVSRGQLLTEDIAPYPLQISTDRVTDEFSKVDFIDKEHPVLNYPNKITENDFENWVQERGLYFPNKWDSEFTPILSMHDKEEEPKEGSLLVAKYGEGYYVYTGLSFFRELPAGVPGAYRLFANLLSLGK
ncbi:MAG TPA: PIG-L family deacetylase [Sphingobacterium sp.]|nr:PIG-L family deacetylase [Sphingobacterium sp.]